MPCDEIARCAKGLAPRETQKLGCGHTPTALALQPYQAAVTVLPRRLPSLPTGYGRPAGGPAVLSWRTRRERYPTRRRQPPRTRRPTRPRQPASALQDVLVRASTPCLPPWPGQRVLWQRPRLRRLRAAGCSRALLRIRAAGGGGQSLASILAARTALQIARYVGNLAHRTRPERGMSARGADKLRADGSVCRFSTSVRLSSSSPLPCSARTAPILSMTR